MNCTPHPHPLSLYENSLTSNYDKEIVKLLNNCPYTSPYFVSITVSLMGIEVKERNFGN